MDVQTSSKVENLLQQIVLTAQKAFGENLVGIYVHGSLAFGCFRWEQSDIDFLVVLENKPAFKEKVQFLESLLKIEKDGPPKGLEMSVVLKKFCEKFKYPTPYELHYSKFHESSCRKDVAGFARKMEGTDRDLAAHFKVVGTVGKAIFGEPPKKVFQDVPDYAYIDSIMADVENGEKEIFLHPVYIILNLCRVLAYLEEEKLLSKEDGAVWGMAHVPQQFQALVKRAGEFYGGRETGNRSSCFSDKELKDFAVYMNRKIEQKWTFCAGGQQPCDVSR